MADVVKVQLKGQEESLSSPPPSKKTKLVQARLPFKVLDQKPATPIPTQGNKKRKLSENSGTTPPGKVSKTPKNNENVPSGKRLASDGDAENEVSSSSETDLVDKHLTNQKPRPLTLLDRFVRTTQQGDVTTSTNEQSDVVDLTDSPVKSSTAEEQKSEGSEDVANVTKKEDKAKLKKGDLGSSLTETVAKVESTGDVKSSVQEKSAVSDVKKGPEDSTVSADADTDKESVVAERKEGDEKSDSVDGLVSSKEENMDVSTVSIDEEDISVLENSVTETDSDGESPTDKNEVGTSQASDAAADKETTGDKIQKSKAPKSAKQLAEKKKRQEERERIMMERQKKREEAKAEKERLLEEKKQQRKLEKEKKDKEREELKAKKEKERLEKQQEKEKEKEEKLKQKEEEKKKKQEEIDAKNEEKRKKEEERKKKEEEKQKQEQEEEEKKKKVKQAFKSFFTKSEKNPLPAASEAGGSSGRFMAFHLKQDMTLAPSSRMSLSTEQVSSLDAGMVAQENKRLYVEELKDRRVKLKLRSRRAEDDDLIIIDAAPTSRRMHVKVLKFHENYRPAYRGTWRKQSKNIRPRCPLGKDKIFDYEVDSDEEWEEEEPGESLSDSEGEKEDGDGDGDGDENGDEDEDEEEGGWMVPHGYLSEGEGCDDDDEPGNPEKMKAMQKQKAHMWEEEMKRKVEVPNTVCIGSLWWDPNQVSQPDPNLDLLRTFTAVPLLPLPIPVSAGAEGPKEGAGGEREPKEKASRLQAVPDEAIPDLIRLVHGNMLGIQKLIREFREYWGRRIAASESKTSSEENSPTGAEDGGEVPMETTDVTDQADSAGPSPTEKTVEATPGTGAKNCPISKRQLDIKIRQIAVYEKRTDFPKLCWYVNEKTLEEHKLKDLPVPTEWNWLTRVKRENGAGTPTPTSRCSTPTTTSTTPTSSRQSIRQFTVPASQLPSPSLVKPVPIVASAADSVTPSKSLPSIKQFTVPASQLPSPSLSKPEPENANVEDSKVNAQTTPKRTTKNVKSITSFFSKKSGQNDPQLKGTDDSKKETFTPIVLDDDDDCMIVETEDRLPLVAPKGQPTMTSMLTTSAADTAQVKKTN